MLQSVKSWFRNYFKSKEIQKHNFVSVNPYIYIYFSFIQTDINSLVEPFLLVFSQSVMMSVNLYRNNLLVSICLLYEPWVNIHQTQWKYKLISLLFIFDRMIQFCFLLKELHLHSFSKNSSHLWFQSFIVVSVLIKQKWKEKVIS